MLPGPRSVMKAGVPWFVGLAMLLVGAGLIASPALAKCRSDCRKQIVAEAKACKSACGKDKVCKKACKEEKKSDVAACKAATNPTPPGCGETTTTTTTATSTSAVTSSTTTTSTSTSTTSTTTSASTSTTEPPCSFVLQWGAPGSGNGEFINPTGIAIDGSGDIYVADSGNNRIQKFDASGTFLTTWGSGGSGAGQFGLSAGVATDGSESVYVSDVHNDNHLRDRVQKFDASGNFLLTWGSGSCRSRRISGRGHADG